MRPGHKGPFISACLIVKNEEHNLERCLQSLQGAVDEIVLLDTGSTDQTVDIATRMGARVLHFEWCDDFSAARNESLRHALGDWIIWVDGDDELILSEPNALRQLCSASPRPEWGYWVNVRSPYGETGDQEVVVRHWRIFPNHKDVWFRGRIHEEPWPPVAIEPSQIGEQSAVSVDHWGYVPRGDLMERKSERNRRLLELSLQEEPWQPLHYYNLGRQMLREGNPAEALPLLERALELWFEHGQPNWSFAHSLFSFAAQAALDVGAFERVLEIERKATDHLVSAELLCSAGIACWRLDRREQAIARLNRAHQDAAVVKPHLHDVSRSTWHPLLMLSGLYDQTGRIEQAYACAQRAAEFAPDHPEIMLAAGYLAEKLGRYDESVAWLNRLLGGQRDDGFKAQGRYVLLTIADRREDPALAVQALSGDVASLSEEQRIVRGAEAHGRLGDLQAQYDGLAAGCQKLPGSGAIRLALADFLVERGYETDALTVLGAGLDQPDPPTELYQRLSVVLAKLGRLDDAANALELATRDSHSSPTAVGEAR